MSNRPQFLEAALAYALRLKWPVFPLKPRAKKPLTEHGHKDATLDETIIRAWWKKWPAANIGIPTGIKFWVLDIDPRNGGEESRAQLVNRHTALADTIRQTTGGGGQQYLYEMPDQQRITCHTGVWPGIDVKGEGGYIVVPPSVHPITGREYEWDTAKRSILEESINPANPWLIAEIVAATANHKGGEPFNLPDRIPNGKQHKTLFQMGCSMRQKGCGYDEILEALWTLNQNRCEQPGPRGNIEKLAASICAKYPAGSGQPSKPPSRPGSAKMAQRHFATISIDAVTPTIELLNACEVFAGQIRFTAVERRGPVIVAHFAGAAAEAVWPTTHELVSFARSQEILAEATQTLIRTPSRRAAKSLWEPAAQLILRLAGACDMTSADSLRDEFQHIILSTWKRAGCPHAREEEVFFDVLRECLEHRRDPQATVPTRSCVWHDDHCSFVHQPSLVEWLSTPAARNKHYDWSEVRKALSLLNFKREQLHLSRGKEIVNVRVWRGPLKLLIDDEA